MRVSVRPLNPTLQFVETSGSELLTGGVTKLKEQLKKVEEGGVLFLDEAYQLNPKTNPMGAQVEWARRRGVRGNGVVGCDVEWMEVVRRCTMRRGVCRVLAVKRTSE